MSDDNILSQEEIDALMNQEDEGQTGELSEEEIDVLGEVGNIAMGSAATALYTLLDKKVEITTPEVEVVHFNDITDRYERPCVVVRVEYIAGLSGINLLILDSKDAAVIADLMMGGEGTDVQEGELDEIHLSAVGEAMNQMMGSSSTAMSSIFDNVVNISPPEARYVEIDDAVNDEEVYFDKEELIVSTSFDLKIADLIDSSFQQLARLDFTKEMVKSLMDSESGGLTAKDEAADRVQKAEEEAAAGTAATAAAAEEESGTTPSRDGKAQPAAQAGQSPGNGERQPASGQVKKEEVGVKTASFPEFDNGEKKALPSNIELIKDVPLQVTVRLGESRMKIEEILDLGEGSIVELDKLAGEPVDLYVNGKLVARGEVVVIDENFGFRVKDIISPMERLNKI